MDRWQAAVVQRPADLRAVVSRIRAAQMSARRLIGSCCMSTATINKAEHRPMSAAEYHAHPALGASMLETFRESRRKFHALYVAKTMTPTPASGAMQLGT